MTVTHRMYQFLMSFAVKSEPSRVLDRSQYTKRVLLLTLSRLSLLHRERRKHTAIVCVGLSA